MLQGHVIDPSELISGTRVGDHFRLTFRNGEVLLLQSPDHAAAREIIDFLGLPELPSAPTPSA